MLPFFAFFGAEARGIFISRHLFTYSISIAIGCIYLLSCTNCSTTSREKYFLQHFRSDILGIWIEMQLQRKTNYRLKLGKLQLHGYHVSPSWTCTRTCCTLPTPDNASASVSLLGFNSQQQTHSKAQIAQTEVSLHCTRTQG